MLHPNVEAGDCLFVLVALSLASLRGFVFPLISPVLQFGKLAHHVCSGERLWPEAMAWD